MKQSYLCWLSPHRVCKAPDGTDLHIRRTLAAFSEATLGVDKPHLSKPCRRRSQLVADHKLAVIYKRLFPST